MADPLSRQLQIDGLQALDATPLDEAREARLKGRKVAGICTISVKVIGSGGKAMTCGLQVILTAIWQSGVISPDWKRAWLAVSIKEKGITRTTATTGTVQHARQGLLLMWFLSQLLELRRPEQLKVMPSKSAIDHIALC